MRKNILTGGQIWVQRNLDWLLAIWFQVHETAQSSEEMCDVYRVISNPKAYTKYKSANPKFVEECKGEYLNKFKQIFYRN